MSDKRLRGVHVTKRGNRAGNYELWSGAPLQTTIRHALDARDWTISDLARAIHSQPSLISRWMMGSRPSVESLVAVAQALALDIKQLLVLAEYLPAGAVEATDGHKAMLKAKIDELEMDDECFALLNSVLEGLRKREMPAKPKPIARPRKDRKDHDEPRIA